MTSRVLKSVLAAIAVLASAGAQARGPSPYLPLNLSPEIERQIERVLILADVPALRRPIRAATVLEALPKACAVDPVLCSRVRRYLSQYMDTRRITHLGAELAYTDSDAPQPLPNRHALNADDEWQVSAQALWQPSDHIVMSLGAVADDSDVTPTNTVLSLGWDYAQLDIGWREHWLSPMTDSSMLVSTQGETMPSLTLSSYRPLTRLGITYEAFIAEMGYSNRILNGATFTDGHPRLAGLSVAIEPVSGWSLAINRVMQYGGGDRSDSWNDLFNAFFNPSKYDNVSDAVNQTQFGNQAASFTSRIVIPGKVPFAAYFEYAGEDTSHSQNYRLGNASLSAGIDFPSLWQRFDATYEVSEWQNGWYVNGVYQDGLANDGYVLGHWFGNQRVFNDAVGGQSHMLRVGWRPTFGGELDARYRTVKNEDYGSVDYTRGHDFTLSYAFPWQRFTVGAELQVGRTVLDEDYVRVAGFMRLAEWIERGTVDHSDYKQRTTDVDLFVDAGVSASKVDIDLADASTDPKSTTDTKTSAHIGIGARRAVAKRHDLGVRIELDDADSRALFAVRALDYRYRMGEHLAFSGFVGAARYDLATPAFGWYYGAGVQWRDILPRLDLNLDVRKADDVARDKLVASDPDPSVGRPDVFYTVKSATLYLTYRW